MDDFLKTVQDAKGDDFVIAEETDPYVHSKIDVRYNRKVTTVTSAKKVTDYKVKQCLPCQPMKKTVLMRLVSV